MKEIEYTLMPESCILGANMTVIQACSEAMGRAGYHYENGGAEQLASMLYVALHGVKERSELRTVFQTPELNDALFHQLIAMAEVDTKPKDEQVVSVKAMAHQFALMLPQHARHHSLSNFSHRRLIRMKLSPADPLGLLKDIQTLYRINAAEPPRTGTVEDRILELEYVGCSPDDIFEAATVFNKQVPDAGSWPEFVLGLVKDTYTIKHIDAGQLQMESRYPRPPDLVWSEQLASNSSACNYDHVVAETVFGPIRIEWKSWKENDTFDFSMPFEINGTPTYQHGYSLDAAKALAQSWYNYYLQKAFGYNVREPE